MKSVITKKGLNLLSQTRADGTVQYWLGYFGLAYVPDELRDSGDDALSTDMSVLTSKGDNIYNLFQGSMVPSGFNTDREDSSIEKSAASKLYNECMYTSDVMSRYRYHIDEETDTNKLVVLKEFADGVTEYCQFDGASYDTSTSQPVDSELPIPAPLYYMGEPSKYNVEPPAEWKSGLPNVSSDTRNYSASVSANPPSLQSETWTADGVDNYDWVASEGNLYTTEPSMLDDYKELSTFWQYQSVSNYNRFHAPANFEGYAVNSDPATRNICKATKLFPLAHYTVQSSINDEKVAVIQYTVEVNMESVFTNVSRRSTVYYDENGVAITDENGNNVDPYPMSFKFNRVGIYAVNVTLHSYNDGDSDTSCSDHHIQMQVNGDEEPILFGVVDLDSPIVMKQGGLMTFNFNLNLNVADTGIVDNSSIYYNLYESDSITWYKNQLIANASTADAVTTLGVQLNYLRKQINEMSSDGSACGIGDDGDRYALAGHTHDYMKNLVDVDAVDNGAVRGVYTQYEGQDFPTATGLSGTYNSGVNSLTMGKKSATASDYSINLSHNGVIGNRPDYFMRDTSTGAVLLGDSGLDDSYITVEKAYNSLMSIGYSSKIPNSIGSVIVSPAYSGYANRQVGDVWYSALIGGTHLKPDDNYRRVKVTEYLRNNYDDLYEYDNEQYKIVPDVPSVSNLTQSVIAGSTTVIVPVDSSLISANGSVGTYDALEDFSYRQASYFPTMAPGGFSTRNLKNVLGAFYDTDVKLGSARIVGGADSSNVPVGSTNVIMLGKYVNTKNDCAYEGGGSYGNLTVYTMEEFAKLCEDPAWTWDQYHTIVIGNGKYSITRGTGDSAKTSVINAHGVCCYISYDSGTIASGATYTSSDPGFCYMTYGMFMDAYAPGSHRFYVPIGDDGIVTNEVESTYSSYIGVDTGVRPHINRYLELYEKPGHYKNLLMLGDYQSAGNGSENSIFIGDYSAWPKVTFKNSIINLLGDNYPYNNSKSNTPKVTFNNVMWFGRIGGWETNRGWDMLSCPDLLSNQCDNRASVWDDKYEIKNKLVFTGDSDNAFGHAYWYGIGYNRNNLSQVFRTSNISVDNDGLIFGGHVPMIYTGGLALGGYGTNECNFMLLKIGMSASAFTENYDKGIWMSSAIHAYESTPASFQFTEAPDTSYGRSRVFTPSIDSYPKIYERDLADGKHYTMDSPYAGMVLMVQQEQELDGTLHVGLGKVKASGGGSGAGRAVVTDFNPLSGSAYGGGAWSLDHPGDDHTYIYEGWKNKNMDKVLTCRPTLDDFIAPVDDMQREHTGTCTQQWYNDYPGFNFEDGITVLDWYFWYAISDYYSTTENSETYYHEQWMLNDRKQMNINMNSLTEGIVYEVNLHVVRVNGPESSTIGDTSKGTDATYRRQASPVTKQYDGSHIDADIFYDPLIKFISYTTKSYSGSCTVHYWGATDTTSSNDIKPTFYPVTEPNTGASDSEASNHQLTELARAKMLFTRIGDKVYIMEY